MKESEALKVTPGEWVVGGFYTVRTAARHPSRICRTRDRHNSNGDEDAANAKLIAASKFLFRAVELLLDTSDGTAAREAAQWDEMMECAKEGYRRATGKEIL